MARVTEKASSSVRFQTLEQMLDAFADFIIGEGVAVDDVFADGAIREPVDAMVDQVKNDGALAILDGVNVHARRPIEAVPATVVAANEAGAIHGGGNALTARLHGELVVDKEVSIGGIADLNQATGIQSLFESAGNAVADDVVLPIRVAFVGWDVVIVRRTAIESVARSFGAPRGGRRTGRAPSPRHAFVNGDGGVTVDYDMIVATGEAEASQNCQKRES